jgi:hypothetical protein
MARITSMMKLSVRLKSKIFPLEWVCMGMGVCVGVRDVAFSSPTATRFSKGQHFFLELLLNISHQVKTYVSVLAGKHRKSTELIPNILDR